MSQDRVYETSVRLLEQVQDGDDAAWRRMTALYGPLLRYWCRQSGVGEGDLEDLTQEIWLSLGPKIRNYRREGGRPFRAWLRGVARHKSWDWRQRQLREPVEAEGGSQAMHRLQQSEAACGQGTDEGEELRLLYGRALELVRDRFEDRTWDAFIAVVIEARPAADVGDELGISASAVRMAKCRVLARIRLELGILVD